MGLISTWIGDVLGISSDERLFLAFSSVFAFADKAVALQF